MMYILIEVKKKLCSLKILQFDITVKKIRSVSSNKFCHSQSEYVTFINVVAPNVFKIID